MRSRFNPRSLRLRLIALVLLAILPSVFLMIMTARDRREMDARKVQQEALRLVLVAASNLQRDILAGRAFLAALAQDIRWPRGGAAACSEDLRRLQASSRFFSTIGVADSTGQVVCQSTGAAPLPNLAATPWFRETVQSRDFSVGYDGDRILSGKVTLDFAMPFRSPEGPILVLFCAFDLDWLNQLAEKLQLPPNSTLTVLGSKDQVLVRYPDPEKWVGNRLSIDPLAASVSLRKQGVTEGPGLDGMRRLYAFTEVPEGKLSLRLGIPTAQAYAAADAAMAANLLWLGVGAFLALLAAWFAGQWMMVRPVDKLVEATRKLASGNLNARTEMNHDDGELGQLARAFDEMAESLEWREAQLRESEQERVQSEGRFTEMVELATDAIIGTDAGFRIFFFNRAAQRIFGYRADEVEGQDLRILEPGAGPPGNGHSELVAALGDPRNLRVEVRVRAKDGSVFPAEASFSRASRDGGHASSCTYTLILREKEVSKVPPEVTA